MTDGSRRRKTPLSPTAGPLPTISRIHEGLVGARGLIGTPYLADPTLRSEYDREIAPRTGLALEKVLREIFPDPEAAGCPRRVLDLGAGTGAAGIALRRYFQDRVQDRVQDRADGRMELVSVDQVIATGAVRPADVTDVPALSRIVAAAPTAGGGGRFDLVIAAHVLNELYLGEAEPGRAAHLAVLVELWCRSLLGDPGTLILIEPALRDTSRALLAVRDHLVAAGLNIVAPCFFRGPCPALTRERDWCHDSVPSAAPPVTQGKSPRRARPVDFSYLVIRTSGQSAADSSLFRIVSDPMPEKGRLKLFACGIPGRHPVVRLDRHVSPANDALDRLARGDVARIVGTAPAQDGLRVLPDSTVTRLPTG